jgi:tyrosyl-tRNA synthetase
MSVTPTRPAGATPRLDPTTALDPATALGASHRAVAAILDRRPDLRGGPELGDLLRRLAERRRLDLSDMAPPDQAALVAARCQQLLPSADALVDRLAAGRPLTVKFGIDPTAADVHLGHAVPMTLASRFQRMGHHVVVIVGDLTAAIGDPSGRTADRPPLTAEDIRRNLATYRQQVTPFVDFERAQFRFNREWLDPVTLPHFLATLGRLPLSAALQREDFRTRLGAGSGLTLAELVYSVVMALDSVEVRADIEIGGVDQLLNLQMCRRVMGNAGLPPEVVLATGLIEGTDGSGAKMSKSRGNYIGLAAPPGEMFGQLMSIGDRLVSSYLRALTELLDPEIERLDALHPMGVKTLLAADVTATVHGLDAATASQASFAARFSRRRLSDTTDTPAVDRSVHSGSTLTDLFVPVTGLVPSRNQVRRIAAGGGLRVLVEFTGEQQAVRLSPAEADHTLAVVLATHTTSARAGARTFLTCGRSAIEVT